MGRHLHFSVVASVVSIFATDLEAFSPGDLASRRIIRRRTPTTCARAVFEDEDCEDLCSAFQEESSPAGAVGRAIPSVTNVTQRPGPRRSNAMWWPQAGPTECETCSGKGEQTCRFCGGTHFLSGIGGETDAVFYEGLGKDCPVCEDGTEVCHECSGTGYLFKWSAPEPNQSESLRP